MADYQLRIEVQKIPTIWHKSERDSKGLPMEPPRIGPTYGGKCLMINLKFILQIIVCSFPFDVHEHILNPSKLMTQLTISALQVSMMGILM